MPTAKRRSATYTISLPPELAEQAKSIARAEGRTMSELFREALRVYQKQRTLNWLAETSAYGAMRNAEGYTEDDVVDLVKQVRREIRAERERASRAAG
jgi:predicted transcriptional regulator